MVMLEVMTHLLDGEYERQSHFLDGGVSFLQYELLAEVRQGIFISFGVLLSKKLQQSAHGR